MTERYSPLDTLLDVFVYAPVGLALVATEEIPKLAAKGRAQLGGQLAMAKVVGQFAVAQGRRQLKPRPAAPSRRRGPAPAQPASPAAASDQPGSTGPGGPADPGGGGPEPAGPGPDGRIGTGAENDAGAAPAGATDRAATVDSPDREADQAGDRAGDDVGPGVGSAHVSSPPSEPVGLGYPRLRLLGGVPGRAPPGRAFRSRVGGRGRLRERPSVPADHPHSRPSAAGALTGASDGAGPGRDRRRRIDPDGPVGRRPRRNCNPPWGSAAGRQHSQSRASCRNRRARRGGRPRSFGHAGSAGRRRGGFRHGPV